MTLSRRSFLGFLAMLPTLPMSLLPLPKLPHASVSGLTLLGATTSEMTTTSAQMVTLATVEGLETFDMPLLVVAHFRKTAGAEARLKFAVNGAPQPGAQIIQGHNSGVGVLVTPPLSGSRAVIVSGTAGSVEHTITLGDVFVYRMEPG